MRRITIFNILLLIFLSSCSFQNVPQIEEYTWEMETIQIAPMGNVVYCSPYGNNEDVYTKAETIIIRFDADDGKFAISDKTNGTTYTGTYYLKDSDLETNEYSININGTDGYAITGITKYLSEDIKNTLIVRIGDYTINFYEKK